MKAGTALAKLVSVFQREPEFFSLSIPHEMGERLEAFVVPEVAESYGLTPPIDPLLLKTLYTTDAMCKSAVDFIVDEVCGMGFYTGANEEAVVTREGKKKTEQLTTSNGETPKEILDDFAEVVDLDGWAQEFVREQLWAGFSMTKMMPSSKKIEELAFLPPESVRRIHVDRDTGKILKIIQQHRGSSATIDPNDMIFLRNCRDPMEPFGFSLFRALASPRTITYVSKTGGASRSIIVPPILTMKARMEMDVSESLHRYGSPKIVWPFPSLTNDADINAEIAKLQQMDADYVTNKEVKPIVLEPTLGRGFDTFISFLENRSMEGLETPMLKLLTTPGFTEASAREATRLAQFKIFGMQRGLKRAVERHFFRPVLESRGVDPVLAEPRLFWGPVEKHPILAADVLTAAREKVIEKVDAQKILRDMGWKISVQEVNQ